MNMREASVPAEIHFVKMGVVPVVGACGASGAVPMTVQGDDVTCRSCLFAMGRPAPPAPMGVSVAPSPVGAPVAAAPAVSQTPEILHYLLTITSAPFCGVPKESDTVGTMTFGNVTCPRCIAAVADAEASSSGPACAYCGEPLPESYANDRACARRPRGVDQAVLACAEAYDPSVPERMTVVSQTPELDGVFAEALDFPACTSVKPGAFQERSFAVSRECRIVGLTFPRGLEVVRVTVKTGPRFKAEPESDPPRPYTVYAGEDCHVFEGSAVRGPEAGWKRMRLTPSAQAGLYVLVQNVTQDELMFEGTMKLVSDRVPRPDHEEV